MVARAERRQAPGEIGDSASARAVRVARARIPVASTVRRIAHSAEGPAGPAVATRQAQAWRPVQVAGSVAPPRQDTKSWDAVVQRRSMSGAGRVKHPPGFSLRLPGSLGSAAQVRPSWARIRRLTW